LTPVADIVDAGVADQIEQWRRSIPSAPATEASREFSGPRRGAISPASPRRGAAPPRREGRHSADAPCRGRSPITLPAALTTQDAIREGWRAATAALTRDPRRGCRNGRAPFITRKMPTTGCRRLRVACNGADPDRRRHHGARRLEGLALHVEREPFERPATIHERDARTDRAQLSLCCGAAASTRG